MLAKANLMAGALCYNFKPDSAFYYYAEAFRFAHDTSCRKILPRLYYNMAMIWFRASDYRQALIFMDSAILLSELHKTDHLTTLCRFLFTTISS